MSFDLRTALSVEGNTDARFLPKLIQRTLRDLITKSGEYDIEVLLPVLIPKTPGLDAEQRIIKAARQAKSLDCDILIVHFDCDNNSLQETRSQQFESGFLAIQELAQQGEEICGAVVSLLPSRTIEAWMIADQEKFIQALEVSFTGKELGLPARIKTTEKVDAKKILNDAIRVALDAAPKRRRAIFEQRMTLFLHNELPSELGLEVLEQLESYQTFKEDLTAALRKLNYIR